MASAKPVYTGNLLRSRLDKMVTTMISNCFETDLSSHANISKWLQVAILKGETVKTQ